MNSFLKKIKSKNNNWVHKTLNKRQRRPIYLALFVSLLIVAYYFNESYTLYEEASTKNLEAKQRIEKSQDRLKKLDVLINSGANRLKEINSNKLDNKKPLAFMTKVCDLLKNREVIGAYYIFKKQNPKYANVLNLEIKVSYGDVDLLFLVTKLVMEQVFFLKSIEQTKNGVKWELYKPVKESES